MKTKKMGKTRKLTKGILVSLGIRKKLKYQEELIKAETEAKEKNIGIWR